MLWSQKDHPPVVEYTINESTANRSESGGVMPRCFTKTLSTERTHVSKRTKPITNVRISGHGQWFSPALAHIIQQRATTHLRGVVSLGGTALHHVRQSGSSVPSRGQLTDNVVDHILVRLHTAEGGQAYNIYMCVCTTRVPATQTQRYEWV